MIKKSSIFLTTWNLLYFRFSTLLAPPEVHRDLQTDNFNRSTGTEKSIFDEFSSTFKDFRWFLACNPIVCLQKSDQSQFSKKFKLEDFFYWKFMFESYQENYRAPLGTPGDVFSKSSRKSVTDFPRTLCSPTRGSWPNVLVWLQYQVITLSSLNKF